MYTLGLDTTDVHCSVAIVNRANVLCLDKREIGRGHAEALAPQVQAALANTKISPSAISRIAVCSGPGSFSGVRVGLGFAKGFALPYATPIIGISVLEHLAGLADPQSEKTVMGVLDVRRGEVYVQTFKRGLAQTPARLMTIEAARHALKDGALDVDEYVGNGASLLDQQSRFDSVNPAVLAWQAQTLSANAHPPTPIYHRPPDAKLPGGLTPVGT